MTTLTIRPTGSPYQGDGQLRSSSEVYADAQSGAGSFAGSGNTASDRIDCGQQLSGSTYIILEGRLYMPLSSLPGAAFVSAATIELTKWFGLNSGTLYAYLQDGGSIVDTGDWVNPTAIAGSLTLLASIPLSGLSGTFQMNAEPALAEAIMANAGGNLGILLVTSQALAGTPPTGDDRFIIRPAEYATEAHRPALILDYRMRAVADHHYRSMRAA